MQVGKSHCLLLQTQTTRWFHQQATVHHSPIIPITTREQHIISKRVWQGQGLMVMFTSRVWRRASALISTVSRCECLASLPEHALIVMQEFRVAYLRTGKDMTSAELTASLSPLIPIPALSLGSSLFGQSPGSSLFATRWYMDYHLFVLLCPLCACIVSPTRCFSFINCLWGCSVEY